MATGRVRLRQPFLFVGNHPCLDFINTQMIVRGNPTDLLGGYEDLVAWLVQARIVTAAQATVIRRQWSHKDQEQLFNQGTMLRHTLREMVKRIVARQSIPGSALAAINRLLAQRPGYPQLIVAQGHFEQRFRSEVAQKDSLLVPLAEAAGDLLCSGDLSLVKKCGNAACILYFYDTTKNHTRSWCSMQLCGNRMKVAAHYLRKRDKSTR